jgi:hypothetical protein
MILISIRFIFFCEIKTTFFQQQNCTTKDSQQKYNSRAAPLYREKLHQSAVKAQRTYGTKVNQLIFCYFVLLKLELY